MKKYQCPACHGSGGEVEVVCDDGTGPKYDCPFCEGKGELLRDNFYIALGQLRTMKREKTE